jgi:uncharacterized membrane protein
MTKDILLAVTLAGALLAGSAFVPHETAAEGMRMLAMFVGGALGVKRRGDIRIPAPPKLPRRG